MANDNDKKGVPWFIYVWTVIVFTGIIGYAFKVNADTNEELKNHETINTQNDADFTKKVSDLTGEVHTLNTQFCTYVNKGIPCTFPTK
jgi:hypothetical protein